MPKLSFTCLLLQPSLGSAWRPITETLASVAMNAGVQRVNVCPACRATGCPAVPRALYRLLRVVFSNRILCTPQQDIRLRAVQLLQNQEKTSYNINRTLGHRKHGDRNIMVCKTEASMRWSNLHVLSTLDFSCLQFREM